jgi:hypothetical protein
VRAVRSHTTERLQLACKDAATRSIEVPVVRKKIHRCLEVESP